MRGLALVLAIAALTATGCADPASDDGADHTAHGQTQALHLAAGESRRVEAYDGIAQIGLLLEGSSPQLSVRTFGVAGWSPWQPAQITFSEGRHHVGRSFFDQPGYVLELRSEAPLDLTVEIFAKVQADPDARLTRDMRRVGETLKGNIGSRQQALAPDTLVISRADWGARDPGRICNDIGEPYRLTVHHTAGNVDANAEDGARVMRQIQAYHIDSKGWCDIGYHFVVSQHGNIYVARFDERRPAAHVANQNSGNIGVSLMGNFEEMEVPDAQFAAAARIIAWATETYGIERVHELAANGGGVRGHREWSTASTACPGANLLPRLNAMIALAISDGWREGGPIPDPDMGVEPDPDAGPLSDAEVEPDPDAAAPASQTRVTIDAEWANLEDAPGTRPGVVDGVVNGVVEVDLLVKNASNHAIRGVRLGYALPADLNAVNYAIYTDAPRMDGSSWQINDADSAPENPGRGTLGRGGEFTLYAFAAGETKRVRLIFDADTPTLAEARPATVQAWIANIDEVYQQESYGAAPTLNTVGATLTAAAAIDIQRVDYWRFDNADPAQLEGWAGCGGPVPTLDRADGALTMAGPNGCARSPLWTQIDAADWDQLVISVDHRAGEYGISVSWKQIGGGFEANNSVNFFATAGAQTYVVPLDGVAGWRGAVDGLRVEFGPGAVAPFDLRSLHLQSTASGRTSDPMAAFSQRAPVDLTDRPDRPDPRADPDSGVQPRPRVDAGVDAPGDASINPLPTSGGGGSDDGCEATGAPIEWLLVLGPLGLFGILRRRRA